MGAHRPGCALRPRHDRWAGAGRFVSTPAPLAKPTTPWWNKRWGLAAAGIVGLLIGTGIGSSSHSTTTTTTTTPAGAPVTVTQTVTRSAGVRTRTVTVTRTISAPRPAPSGQPPPSGAGGGGHSYNGNGEQQIGTITVAQDSTLRWTCSGACSIFDLTNDPNDDNSISLTSVNGANSGQTNVSAGTYHKVQTITGGSWTFTITPG